MPLADDVDLAAPLQRRIASPAPTSKKTRRATCVMVNQSDMVTTADFGGIERNALLVTEGWKRIAKNPGQPSNRR